MKDIDYIEKMKEICKKRDIKLTPERIELLQQMIDQHEQEENLKPNKKWVSQIEQKIKEHYRIADQARIEKDPFTFNNHIGQAGGLEYALRRIKTNLKK